MKTSLAKLLLVLLATASSCGGKLGEFPMNKPHWGPVEYDQAIKQIRFKTPQGEKYPTLDDPELGIVFRQLINRENITVVTDDATSGIRFKAEFMQDMFERYRELLRVYHERRDREDHFVYDSELAEVLKFGLFVQVNYFGLGNELMLSEADKPEQVATTIRENETILLKNFNNYLDYVNNEKSFSESALESYTMGLKDEFDMMIQRFPDAPFNISIEKAEAMVQKAVNANLKTSLQSLIARLKAKDPAN